MTDNGAKALAERLHETGECENWSPGYRDFGPDGDVILDEVGDSAAHRRSADAILANGARFLTAEEAERLRRIEATARAVLDHLPFHRHETICLVEDELRAALTDPEPPHD